MCAEIPCQFDGNQNTEYSLLKAETYVGCCAFSLARLSLPYNWIAWHSFRMIVQWIDDRTFYLMSAFSFQAKSMTKMTTQQPMIGKILLVRMIYIDLRKCVGGQKFTKMFYIRFWLFVTRAPFCVIYTQFHLRHGIEGNNNNNNYLYPFCRTVLHSLSHIAIERNVDHDHTEIQNIATTAKSQAHMDFEPLMHWRMDSIASKSHS